MLLILKIIGWDNVHLAGHIAHRDNVSTQFGPSSTSELYIAYHSGL